MSLLTDGTISSLDELQAYDSSVLDVASTENIDVTAKLALAQKQIEVELTRLLGCLDLGTVVVTEPLRQWHMLQTLSLVYVDAYYRQLNDRYSGRWMLYRDLARGASEALFQVGIGTVENPIGRPAPPQLTAMAGPLPAATYYGRVSWTNGAGEEGSPSEAAVISAPDGHILGARILPAENLPPSPANPLWRVAGWNLYLDLSLDGITLQNDTPLALDETWTELVSGLRSGRRPGDGQPPSQYLTLCRILQRG